MAVDTSTMSTPHSQISPRIWRPLPAAVAVWSSRFPVVVVVVVIDRSAFILISYRCYSYCFCCALCVVFLSSRLLVSYWAQRGELLINRKLLRACFCCCCCGRCVFVCLLWLAAEKSPFWGAQQLRSESFWQITMLWGITWKAHWYRVTQGEWGTLFVVLFYI